MNWLANLMDLPIDFHFFGKGSSGGGGGGIIQVSFLIIKAITEIL